MEEKDENLRNDNFQVEDYSILWKSGGVIIVLILLAGFKNIMMWYLLGAIIATFLGWKFWLRLEERKKIKEQKRVQGEERKRTKRVRRDDSKPSSSEGVPKIIEKPIDPLKSQAPAMPPRKTARPKPPPQKLD